jgi:hypothetical protein
MSDDTDDIPPPSKNAMDADWEAATGRPLKMSPQAGIEAMKARIASLRAEVCLDDADDLARVNREIKVCQDRLGEYQLLQRSEN